MRLIEKTLVGGKRKWKITNFNRIAGSLGIEKETGKVKKQIKAILGDLHL